MNKIIILATALSLNACTWTIDTSTSGSPSIHQRYPTGTPLLQQSGHHNLDPRYHDNRPRVIPILQDK